MLYLLAAIAVFGHWALSIYVINRLHATALPHRLMKCVDLLWYFFLMGIPLGIAAAVIGPGSVWLLDHSLARAVVTLYACICWVAAMMAVPVWIRHVTQSTITHRLESNHSRYLDVVNQIGHDPSATLSTRVLANLPLNEVFRLAIHEKTLRVPRLPACLEGLTLTHVSDLHFTGRIRRSYFDLVIEQANALDADLIVISGDIIDKRKCFSWLAEVLGRLRAREGVYFVLGNHDLRIRNELGLRKELTRLGMTDLGGRHVVRMIRNYPVLFAGNELPWFAPAADMRRAPGAHAAGRPFRIAVSHSPDQFPWAKLYDFDLMLAGHTHGGQIRFPWVGPIFSPSQFGVKYASGAFYEEPTLLHVSRGLSGTRPLRFNCAPELTKLILRTETPRER